MSCNPVHIHIQIANKKKLRVLWVLYGVVPNIPFRLIPLEGQVDISCCLMALSDHYITFVWHMLLDATIIFTLLYSITFL